MIIFIRHGNDEVDDVTYRQDNKINYCEKGDISELAKKLIKKHGRPEEVYCSPFRRTITTAAELCKAGKVKKFKVRNYLGRRFSKKEQKKPDIAPETKEYCPIIKEDKEGFKKRCLHAYENIKSKDGIVWVVTHALVLKKIAKHVGLKLPKHIPFLYYFVVDN